MRVASRPFVEEEYGTHAQKKGTETAAECGAAEARSGVWRRAGGEGDRGGVESGSGEDLLGRPGI